MERPIYEIFEHASSHNIVKTNVQLCIKVKIKHKNLRCRNSDINVVHFTFTTVFILLLIKNQPRNLITRRERKRKVKVSTEKDRGYGYDWELERCQGRELVCCYHTHLIHTAVAVLLLLDVVFFVLGDHTLSHCTGQDNALHRGILWQFCSVLTRPSSISPHGPGCWLLARGQ